MPVKVRRRYRPDLRRMHIPVQPPPLQIFRVHDIIEAVAFCTLGNLVAGLADQHQIAYLSAKALDPLVKLGMLIISACD